MPSLHVASARRTRALSFVMFGVDLGPYYILCDMLQLPSSFVNQLAVKLSTPYVASLTLGVGLTGYFFFGNLAVKTQGPLAVLKTTRAPTVGEVLNAWTWTFNKGKIQFGISKATASTLFLVAAYTSPNTAMKTPLLLASALGFSIIGWTLVMMKPINDRLLYLHEAYTKDPLTTTRPEVDSLVKRWERLHLIRILLSGATHALGTAVILLSA